MPGASHGARFSPALANQAYVLQSRYDLALPRWLESFPREQVLILLSEDFYRDPREVFATVQRFLGLAAEPLGAYPKGVNTNSSPSTLKITDMRVATIVKRAVQYGLKHRVRPPVHVRER
jgi:hypothetical protein